MSEFRESGIGETPEPGPVLPKIESAADLVADEQAILPPELIPGVLHQGSKMILGAGSKDRKTWGLLDLSVSVGAGVPWLKFATRAGQVLFINFEIGRPFIRRRILAICEAKHIPKPVGLDVWNLRGFATKFGVILPRIADEIRDKGYALIVIDPVYKGLGGRDENAAGDIAELCNEIERLAVKSGAAVVFAAHFSKGNQAAKEAMDRIGGSGVFARDADSIITLTKHREDGALTVEMSLRNHPPQPPFAIRWACPIFELAEDLNPEDLKKCPGRKAEHTPEDVLEVLRETSPLGTCEWCKACEQELGLSRRTFYALRAKLEETGEIEKDRQGSKTVWRIAEATCTVRRTESGGSCISFTAAARREAVQ